MGEGQGAGFRQDVGHPVSCPVSLVVKEGRRLAHSGPSDSWCGTSVVGRRPDGVEIEECSEPPPQLYLGQPAQTW